jgi:RimJ/RimL family protein N-acetyltransferase
VWYEDFAAATEGINPSGSLAQAMRRDADVEAACWRRIRYTTAMGSYSKHEHRLRTGETIVVRSARPEDALRVLTLAKAVVDEDAFMATTSKEFDCTEESKRNWICSHADDPGKVLLLAESSGQIIGMLAIESRDRKRLAHRASLHMSVAKEWRSRGAGTILLQSAVEWARSHPVIEALCLAVFATNTRAIGLYKKLGFIEEGRRIRELKISPGEYVDDIIMYRFVKDV